MLLVPILSLLLRFFFIGFGQCYIMLVILSSASYSCKAAKTFTLRIQSFVDVPCVQGPGWLNELGSWIT